MIGIKYCGGCNPRYNRENLVAELKTALPDTHFVFGEEALKANILIVVSGCASACPTIDENPNQRVLWIREQREVQDMIRWLEKMTKKS
jgi:hypothetical protein